MLARAEVYESEACPNARSAENETLKTRTASCCGGDLCITVSGEPERVIACHCDHCQKRTGNVFQVSCWYFGEQIVSRSGDFQIFNDGPNNAGIDYTFCKRCGSTVYWEFVTLREAMNVSLYRIAVACFVDADFPSPDLECWTSMRHHWIAAPEGADSYDEFPPQERLVPTRP